MFSSFKNIVNNSLQELDRLGESSFGLPNQHQQHQDDQDQQQQQQYQQQQQQYFNPSRNGHRNDRSVDGLYPSQLQGPGIPAGSRRSPNMHARSGTFDSGRSSPVMFASQAAGNMTPARAASPVPSGGGSMSMPRPVSSSGPSAASAAKNNSSNNHQQSERRESFDGLPDFGFSNLKRSLSGMNKATLDLSGLRSSLDLGRPTSSGGSPSTPSRDLYGNLSGGPLQRPSLSTSGGRRRKTSARSFSISGMTGPYTPNTMMRQDPFFFAELQALPDDLKLAAFTPLPTEDDDEYLEGIDNELNAQSSTFPSTLPHLTMPNSRKAANSRFSGPSSAPAGGFMRLPFGSPPALNSPSLENGRSIFGKLEDHLEEEERASARPSPSMDPLNLPEKTEDLKSPAAADDVKASSDNTDEPPRPNSGLGLGIPSPTFASPPNTAVTALTTSAPVADAPLTHPLAVPSTEQHITRSTSPALPPKQESLQARLARLAQSRATAKAAATTTGSAQPQPVAAASSAISSPPVATKAAVDSVSATPNLAIASVNGTQTAQINTSGSSAAQEPKSTDSPAIVQTLESLLKRYTPVSSIQDTASIETFLQQAAANAASSSAKFDASQANSSKQRDSDRITIQTLESELKEARANAARAEAKAKEEEEKKAKSISLLKAVRQKLLKAEKDKEEVEVMRDAFKASEEGLKNELRQRTQRLESEILSTRSMQEREVARLKASFDREAHSIRGAAEREAAAKRGQYEIELLNLRSAQMRELQMRDSRINTLETNLRDLRREKDGLFEQLQMKQDEVESAITSQDRVQVSYDELQYELKETKDRIAALQEEVHSFKKARLDQTRDEGHTRRLLSELESANADKIRNYEDRIRSLEKERSEAENSMATKLQEKSREVEKMRRELERRDAENSEETTRRAERQQRIERAEKQNLILQDKVNALEMLLNEARLEVGHLKEEQATTQELLADQTRRVAEIEGRNEDLSAKEGQLRIANKNLREELRKVQAGILLSEKSRNPGIGYFSSFSQAGSPSASNVNLAGARSPPLPSTPGFAASSQSQGPAMNGAVGSDSRARRESTTSLASEGAVARAGGVSSDDEALNFEYIRNVILQFLEHKEMRPHLISVLAVILHFTPAETRRLTSKANA